MTGRQSGGPNWPKSALLWFTSACFYADYHVHYQYSLLPCAGEELVNFEDKFRCEKKTKKKTCQPLKVCPCETRASQGSPQQSSTWGCGRSSECILALRAPAQRRCVPLGFWSSPLEPWEGKRGPNDKDRSGVQHLYSLAKRSDTRQRLDQQQYSYYIFIALEWSEEYKWNGVHLAFIGMATGVYEAVRVDRRKPDLPLLLAQYQIHCLRKDRRRRDSRWGRCVSLK